MNKRNQKISRLFLIRNELQKTILGLRTNQSILNEQESREVLIGYGEYLSKTQSRYPEYIFSEFNPTIFEECLYQQRNSSLLEAEKYYQNELQKSKSL